MGLLFSLAAARAQTSVVGAALDGAIVDSSGGRIAGVPVTVREVTTHYAREVFTNAEGSFQIAQLPPGTYASGDTQNRPMRDS